MEPGPAEQEIIQQQEPTEQEQTKTQKKQYIRKFTDEGRAKQKQHLDEIRKKAMEKKKEMREITLKAKLMKLEPKLNLAKKYDEYITSKLIKPEPLPEPDTRCAAVTESPPEPDTRCAAVTESRPEVKIIKKPKQKKIIYKEISDDEDEEEIVYIKKPKPKQETYDRTLYKSATEQLHMRAVEERIRNNLLKWRHALEPVEY